MNHSHNQIISENLQASPALIPQAQVFQLSQSAYFYKRRKCVVVRVKRAKIGHCAYMELAQSVATDTQYSQLRHSAIERQFLQVIVICAQ